MQAAGFLPESPGGPMPRRGRPMAFPRCDIAPVTEAQREIFYSVQMGDEANCSYNESNIIRFDGALDTSGPGRALQIWWRAIPRCAARLTRMASTSCSTRARSGRAALSHDLSGL